MFLRLAVPEAGAALAVCDLACARAALVWASAPVVAASHVWPGSSVAVPAGGLLAAGCVRCAACGGVIDAPYPRPCFWHPEGCPDWQQTHTVVGAAVVRRLVARHGLALDDLALGQLEHTLGVLAGEGSAADPEEAYRLLRLWLEP